METKITQKSPVVIQAEVNLPWDKVEQSYKKSIREISGMVSMPGFRKGRAPVALLKKKYREDIVNSVARERIPELLPEVIKTESIKAVGEPQITHFSLKEKESFSFEFLQEVKPEIELNEWKGFELESLNVVVTDEMLDNRIQSILDNHAKKEEIKDQPAVENDIIKFQFTILDNSDNEILFDENFTEPLSESFPYPSLKKDLMSVPAGEDVELNITAPDDFEIENARGKDIKIFLEIQSIMRENTPVLDESFAKHEGAESVEDFKAKTREELEKQAADMEKQRIQAALMDKILPDYDFETPYSLVTDNLKYMANSELGPYLNYIQDEKQRQALVENFFETRRPGAERLVRYELILEKIKETENLDVTDEELKAKMVELFEYIPEESKAQIDPQDVTTNFAFRVKEDMLNQKAKDLIYDFAKLKIVDELTPPPEPETPEESTDTPEPAEETVEKGTEKAPESEEKES